MTMTTIAGSKFGAGTHVPVVDVAGRRRGVTLGYVVASLLDRAGPTWQCGPYLRVADSSAAPL